MEGCTYFLLYGDSRPLSRSFCVGEVGMAYTQTNLFGWASLLLSLYGDSRPLSRSFCAGEVGMAYDQTNLFGWASLLLSL